MADVRFFTMSDADNFLGLAAMMKSLRRQGHHEPITVLDLGLTPAQRAMLSPAVDLVQLPEAAGRHPFFLVAFPYLLHPAGTVVYIDADVIVTQPLGGVLAAAASGMLCAAPDFLADRWFAEWQSIFALAQPLRRGVYVNAGFVAFSAEHFPDLLRRWWECCDGLAGDHSWPLPIHNPVGLLDQDALNALLMSEVPEDRIWLLSEREAIQGEERLARTTVLDRRQLACCYEGHSTVLLHAWGQPKPWQPAARHHLRRTAYLVCLRRLLTADDPPPIAPTIAPPWLRRGPVGLATLHGLVARRRVATRVRRLRSRIKRLLRMTPWDRVATA
jgi:hypothetical protein